MNVNCARIILVSVLSCSVLAATYTHADAAQFKSLHTFVASGDGTQPQYALLQASDGELYGATASGGQAGYGELFELSASGKETRLYSFAQANGSPSSALLQGADGRLYGTANSGTEIYAIGTDGSGFTIIHTIAAPPNPYLLTLGFAGTDGRLYGEVTSTDLEPDYGAVFAINTDGSGYQTLHPFAKTDGQNPTSLLLGVDGRIYGTTRIGGPEGFGVVFGMNLDGSDFGFLRSFDGGLTHRYPTALVQANSGMLYGATQESLFALSTTGADFKTLDINTAPAGAASLVAGKDGKLYGIARLGQYNQQVFRVNSQGKDYTVLVSFNGASLAGMYGVQGLIQAASGRIYGVAQSGGGPYNGGAVFSCSAIGSGFKVVHAFAEDVTDPQNPVGGVIQASDGNFYGVTAHGGSSNDGCVYRITSAGDMTILHQFSGPDGATPFAPLLQGSDGRLYGTTESEANLGADYSPTIFSIGTDGSGFVSLGAIPEGFYPGDTPVTALIQADDGKLYGSTSLQDDAYGNGSVFSLETNGSELQTIFDFGTLGEDQGIGPANALTLGSNGLLYGIATYVIGEGPFLYSLATDGSSLTNLYSLASGVYISSSPLVQAANGTFYGTSLFGGSDGYGNVFAIKPDGTEFTEVHSFEGSDGSFPGGPFVLSQKGIVFGVTVADAFGDPGIAYSLSTKSGEINTLYTFSSTSTIQAGSEFPPLEGVIQGTDGALYGVTYQSGTASKNGTVSAGIVYMLKP